MRIRDYSKQGMNHMSGLNIVYSEASDGYAPWNYNLPASAITPEQYNAFTPYNNSNYAPLSFQQRSSTGEPLPMPYAGLQAVALETIAKDRYLRTPQTNPYQTFANYGGLNQYGFANSQFPPDALNRFFILL